MGECTENVVEMKLAKITSAEECKKKSINAVLIHRTLCYCVHGTFYN